MGWYARGWSHRGEGRVGVFASARLEFRRLHRAGVSPFARGVCCARRGCIRRCAPPPFHPRPSHCSSAPPLLPCPSRVCRLPRSAVPPNFAAVFPHGAPLAWVWLRSRFLGDRLSCEARLLVCVWCPVVFVGRCLGRVCLSSSVVRLFSWDVCWPNLLSWLLYCEDCLLV